MWRIVVTFASLCFMSHVASEFTPVQRILNGYNATSQQFPHQTYLLAYRNSRPYSDCGGVLVSTRMVLTAAHCVDFQLTGIDVYFGMLDTTRCTKGRQVLQLGPDSVVMHPLWDSNALINDIAIVHLPADILVTNYIKPAKLPEARKSYDNQRGIVSGYGLTQSGTTPTLLQYYNATSMSNSECQQFMETAACGFFFTSSYICLKPSSSSVCFGDSGGPFVIPNADGSSTLIGITSFLLSSTCQVNLPVFFTRVSAHLEWIEQNRI